MRIEICCMYQVFPYQGKLAFREHCVKCRPDEKNRTCENYQEFKLEDLNLIYNRKAIDAIIEDLEARTRQT